MSETAEYLSPAEAARRLGASAKALRIYERQGLLAPLRTAAGWRAYGPEELARAAEIVALRRLGLALGAISRVLDGDSSDLAPALAAQQASLEARIHQLTDAAARVRSVRAGLADGRTPTADAIATLTGPPAIAFDLPLPWGGERFETPALGLITYVTGPLGSGKTQLAECLARALPEALFLALDRTAKPAQPRLDADPALAARVGLALSWLAEDGAARSNALVALLAHLEADTPAALVVDLVEHGLDEASQAALAAYVRRRGPIARPLVLLTRSNIILDLDAVGAGETIFYCPANHSLPMRVAPYPGAPGFEALASCLASPEVRARTAGMTVTVAA
ncbi:MAG TPA: MerR family transcriptional regulator [Caulobacteraceae bacterium]